MAKRPDEELILYFYGEHEAPDAVQRDLANDGELAERYLVLQRELGVLNSLNGSEPRPGLETRMWARVSAELSSDASKIRSPRARWLPWAAAAAIAAVAMISFLAGRGLRQTPTVPGVTAELKALAPEARDRVLQAALANHLDASQRLLLEVANGAPAAADERAWAETLLSANRLYRSAARRAGQHRVAALLAELEPFFIQLANAPDTLDLQRSQEQIRHDDLLFKVRVTRSNMKELS